MQRRLVVTILLISTVYSVVAALSYLLHFAAYPLALSQSVLPAIAVAVPYGLLLIVYVLAREPVSRAVVFCVVVASSVAAAFVYADSFRLRTAPDMYSGVYYLLPTVQFAAALASLVIVAWRSKSRRARLGGT